MAYQDDIGKITERSTERMNFRTKPHVKTAIQKAALLAGVDDSAFTMNAAYQAAMATIAEHERTVLNSVDHAAFFDALDNPPSATGDLQSAFDRYQSTVASR
jgi:uncharacterized protein (DUF1778 family)